MSPKEHANLLGIFFWVLAGLQGLFLALIGFYMMMFGFLMLEAARSNPKNTGEVKMVMTIIFVFVIVYLMLALFFCITNVLAGYGLRQDKPWAKRWATIGSIMALLSFICGGLWVMPIGIALGIYGLWFVFGAYGQYYFANLNNPQMLYAQMNPPSYQTPPPTIYQNWQ